MMRRTIGLLMSLALGLLIAPVAADAQQPTKVPRIGMVSGGGDPGAWTVEIDAMPPGGFAKAFRQGLRELGYREGETILIERRTAAGHLDRIPGLVAELLQLHVDVLVSRNRQAIRAAKEATKTVPIVMVYNADPVADGIVESLARPGGNITGVTTLTHDLRRKRLELLTEMMPGIARVGVLGDADEGEWWVTVFQEYEAAARALKIPLQALEVRGHHPDFEGTFEAAAQGGARALIAIRGFFPYSKRLADLAIKHQLMSMYEESSFVEAGGLVSYTSNDAENYGRAAVYVDKILKGAKPADLPIEEPTKFGSATQVMLATQFRATVGQKHHAHEGGQQQPWSFETRVQRVDRHSSRKTAIFTAANRIISARHADASLWPVPKTASFRTSSAR
jgi:putative tryptophan/tyrosine transport system substrate-binding protein